MFSSPIMRVLAIFILHVSFYMRISSVPLPDVLLFILQIFVRQKNRCSSKANDNPIKVCFYLLMGK